MVAIAETTTAATEFIDDIVQATVRQVFFI